MAKVADPSRVRNPIDAFVLAKLEAASLNLSPEADKTTLIRRATFDLWGVTYSAKAAAQVSSYSFAKEAPLFYANARYNTNNHDTTVRVDMTVPMPVWPL